MTARSATMVEVISGVRAQRDDVLVVVHPAGKTQRIDDRHIRDAQKIEQSLEAYNCVMVRRKEMHKLGDYFGGLWTEDAQYRISRAEQRHVLALAYGGELMNALKHVNAYLGGQISFFGDNFRSFIGSKVDVADTGGQLMDHSARCFVVGLNRFCS